MLTESNDVRSFPSFYRRWPHLFSFISSLLQAPVAIFPRPENLELRRRIIRQPPLPSNGLMRLINVKTGKLEEFHENIPSYAILSHTWGPDHEEISFRDAQEGHTSKPGFGKVKFDGCCRQAKVDGLEYAWIDTCCIDKTNAVELSEAINSMFRWYQMADKCYAILADELVAPRELVFYNNKWKSLGSKRQLAGVVAEVTGIPRSYLLGIAKLQDASVAQRMSWAANRTTKRREDMAYSLLGIFNVMIPMIYGEGDMAFIRLQEEIMRKTPDDSILAWDLSISSHSGKPRNEGKHIIGNALASSPANFAGSGIVVSGIDLGPTIEATGVSRGHLHTRLPLHITEDGQTFGLLNCRSRDNDKAVVGIPMVCVTPGEDSDEFMRPAGSKAIMIVGSDPAGPPRPVRIHESPRYEDATNYNRRYGFYIEVPSSRELDIIGVYPKERWESKTSFVFTGVDFSKDSVQRTWIKVRHTPSSSSKDFVVSLELEVKGSKPQARCYLMVASRHTKLGRIDEMQKSPDALKHLLSQQVAGDLSVGLEVTLTEERLRAGLIFVVRLAETVDPPEVTVDADAEMELMQYRTCLQKLFKEEKHVRPKLDAFSEIAQGKSAEIAHIEEMIQQVELELREKEEKRHVLSLQLAEKREELNLLTRDNVSFRGLDEDINKMVTKSRGLSATFGEQRFSAWLDSMLDHLLETFPEPDDLPMNSMPDKIQRVFMRAVGCGNVAAMSFLHDHLDGTNFESDTGYGILSTAVRTRNLPAARWVIEKMNLDINQLDSYGHNALHNATWRGFTEAVRLLLNHGASVKIRSKSGWSPLHLAASAGGTVEMVRLLLDQGADVLEESENGNTPLVIAVTKGHVPIVELLLERGALTLLMEADGATPLHAAAGRGNIEVALLLLRHGSDIRAKMRGGDSALHVAAQEGHAKMVELLLDRGADIESTGYVGRTPLMVAAFDGRDGIVAMLLKRGAALEAKDEDGRPAIFYAACCKQKSGVLGLLIDHGAGMNALDHYNWTPLHDAVSVGHTDAVRQLIERGADVSLETRAGNTALKYAQGLSKTVADEEKEAMLEIIKILQVAVTARKEPPPPSSVKPRRKSKKSKRP
ncbi:37s ribosomal protein rsm22 [Colletotrichum sojae]|uniref:37s ribosomal protein rsm22 n=1 Tax=Colletotrichum sojae TaxID=2175907 RepID=A0A8H6IPK3_9PEZI|nr:37s ribosomal protein rsm22 [Colletotrichum sojae]